MDKGPKGPAGLPEEDLDDYTKMWDEAKNEYWLERDLEDDEDYWDEQEDEEEDE